MTHVHRHRPDLQWTLHQDPHLQPPDSSTIPKALTRQLSYIVIRTKLSSAPGLAPVRICTVFPRIPRTALADIQQIPRARGRTPVNPSLHRHARRSLPAPRLPCVRHTCPCLPKSVPIPHPRACVHPAFCSSRRLGCARPCSVRRLDAHAAPPAVNPSARTQHAYRRSLVCCLSCARPPV